MIKNLKLRVLKDKKHDVDEDMDSLCNALNTVSGIQTTSCSRLNNNEICYVNLISNSISAVTFLVDFILPNECEVIILKNFENELTSSSKVMNFQIRMKYFSNTLGVIENILHIIEVVKHLYPKKFINTDRVFVKEGRLYKVTQYK